MVECGLFLGSCEEIKESGPLQVSSKGLLALDGFEEAFEIPCTEPVEIVSLDDFEEDGGPICQRLGEDLDQVSAFVEVDQEMEFADCLKVFV